MALLRRQLLLLPVWWLAIIVLDPRARMTLAMLPMAMLAGLAVSELLLPLLRGQLAAPRAFAPRGDGTPPVREMHAADAPRGRWAHLAPAALLGGLLAYSALGAVVTRTDLADENQVLQSLTPADREAMRWVREQTPAASRFALVTGTGGGWAHDRHAEWFPVLAARRSVGTVQGTEWLARGTFAQRIESAEELQACRTAGAACVEAWARDYNAPFTHVYVPKRADPDDQCCQSLLASLRGDPRYTPVYDGPGAAVFAAPSSVAAR